MLIDIKDIITLDDNNEYVVVSKINYNNKTYYQLLEKSKMVECKFCYEDNDELVELEDSNLIAYLLPFFMESTKEALN